jgi:hypothetical protein
MIDQSSYFIFIQKKSEKNHVISYTKHIHNLYGFQELMLRSSSLVSTSQGGVPWIIMAVCTVPTSMRYVYVYMFEYK